MESRQCDRGPLSGAGSNSEAHVMADRPRRSSKRNKTDSGDDEPAVVISVVKKENSKPCRHGGCQQVYTRPWRRTDHEPTTQHQSAEGADPKARCNMVPCGEEGECQVPVEMAGSFIDIWINLGGKLKQKNRNRTLSNGADCSAWAAPDALNFVVR
jgi:hypothetical protein